MASTDPQTDLQLLWQERAGGQKATPGDLRYILDALQNGGQEKALIALQQVLDGTVKRQQRGSESL